MVWRTGTFTSSKKIWAVSEESVEKLDPTSGQPQGSPTDLSGPGEQLERPAPIDQLSQVEREAAVVIVHALSFNGGRGPR